MDISKFGKGLEPSKFDERDYALSSVTPTIMRYPDICPAPFDLTITNQGIQPSCVGHACSGVKQEKELREKVAVEFDPEWLYKEAKKIDGIPEVKGTYLRVGMQLLKDKGIKPIDGTDPSPYKISKYALVDDISFEGLKKSIFLYGALMAGFRGSNEGWQGEFIKPPKAGEAMWGHAVKLIAYESDYIIGENSWGKDWGNQGRFKFGRDYLPFETWAIVVDTPTEFQPIKTGWVANIFLQLVGGVWRTTVNLNVRTGAGTSFGIIKTLQKGTVVQVVDSPTVSANGFVWQQIII